MLSSMLTKGSVKDSYSKCKVKSDLSQGDLGHTDLQEDLEFHSSSTSPRYSRTRSP